MESISATEADHVSVNARHIHFRASSFVRRLWYWWWIVPRVQYDLADLDYQLYTFEVFHQDWRTKLAHYVTIPAIAFFCMAFASQFHLAGLEWANGGLIYVALLAAIHARWCFPKGQRSLWVVSVGLLLALWPFASVWMQWWAVDGGSWLAPTALVGNPLLWIYVFSFVETLSHALEPVPPYATGSDRFMQRHEFWRDQGTTYGLAALVGLPTMYTFVSFASNLHLLPTFVLRILASCGLQSGYVREIESVAKEQWRSGQPVIHQIPNER